MHFMTVVAVTWCVCVCVCVCVCLISFELFKVSDELISDSEIEVWYSLLPAFIFCISPLFSAFVRLV